jgi:hypothetical protein
MQGIPAEDFPNVVPLEKLAGGKQIQVDTPDTAPPADAAEQGLTEAGAPARRAAAAAPSAGTTAGSGLDSRSRRTP